MRQRWKSTCGSSACIDNREGYIYIYIYTYIHIFSPAAHSQVSFALPPHVVALPSGGLGADAKGDGAEFAVAFFDAEVGKWMTEGVADAE